MELVDNMAGNIKTMSAIETSQLYKLCEKNGKRLGNVGFGRIHHHRQPFITVRKLSENIRVFLKIGTFGFYSEKKR